MKDRLTVECCGKYITYKGITHNQCKQRLGEYEEAEEQGLLLRLPIAEDTESYMIVEAYSFGEVGDKAEAWYSIHEVKFNRTMIEEWGKTVFPTKAEAEQALAKMQG